MLVQAMKESVCDEGVCLVSNLLRKPHKGQSCLHQITPADAGWRYVGFGVHDLVSGQLLSDVGTDDEVCLVRGHRFWPDHRTEISF